MDAQPTVADRPDWAEVDEEILCPLCDYNLRGLQESRCPECGFRFNWPDMLDPNRRHHPYVFEHHPERNVWSFWKTLCGGLRPKRFWQSLHPAQPSRPGRLIGYGLLVSCFILLPGVVHLVPTAIYHSQDNVRTRKYFRAWIRKTPRASRGKDVKRLGVEGWLDTIAPRANRIAFWKEVIGLSWVRRSGIIGGLCIAWPVITYASLLIFRWSMRRAKVKRGHVLRCVIYSYDTLVWICLASCAVFGFPVRSSTPWIGLSFPVQVSALMLLVSVVLMSYRLCVAYKRYMRFDHSVATVIATQIMYGLILAIAVPWLYLWF